MTLAPATASSYDRLLRSGKRLFATRGYANTSTIMIARDAGTSESQLVKHFGGKDGLLAAIFDQGWQRITQSLAGAGDHASPLGHLRRMIEEVLAELERDPELCELMMLEGRRIRREGNMILLTRGYRDFTAQVDQLLAVIRDQGGLNPELPSTAVRAAVMGMCEGMMREQVLARRQGSDPGYSAADVRRVVEFALRFFLTQQTQASPATAGTGERSL